MKYFIESYWKFVKINQLSRIFVLCIENDGKKTRNSSIDSKLTAVLWCVGVAASIFSIYHACIHLICSLNCLRFFMPRAIVDTGVFVFFISSSPFYHATVLSNTVFDTTTLDHFIVGEAKWTNQHIIVRDCGGKMYSAQTLKSPG